MNTPATPADIQRHTIDAQASILTALQRLNKLSGKAMTLFVIDNIGAVIGTLTDGDIRRALCEGIDTAAPVTEAAHTGFAYIDAEARPDVRRIAMMRSRGITLVPVLDRDKRLTRIVDLRHTSTCLPVSAILMAGGKGERLRPLTNDTPKPLLHVGDRAIIDYNIDALAAAGITDITVTTGYLAEQLDAHFADGANAPEGVRVRCVRETFPMGTIGAAALIDHTPGGTTLVMNSDLLTTISFEQMYLRHIDTDADITIAAISYQVSVPFAILATDDASMVRGIEEKPSYTHYANAGIYLISNDLLSTLDTAHRTDATDLVADAIAAGRRVTYYPVDGIWMDIGTPADFAQACRLMENHRRLNDSRMG